MDTRSRRTFSASPPTAPAPTLPGPAPGPSPGTQPALTPGIADLVRSANDHLTRSQQALKEGDWARYGEEQRLLQEDLQRLGDLTGR